ncbi:hypothetical protein ACQEUU_04965 [Nonomuraea sp. CA-218870]
MDIARPAGTSFPPTTTRGRSGRAPGNGAVPSMETEHREAVCRKDLALS